MGPPRSKRVGPVALDQRRESPSDAADDGLDARRRFGSRTERGVSSWAERVFLEAEQSRGTEIRGSAHRRLLEIGGKAGSDEEVAACVLLNLNLNRNLNLRRCRA